ncbi:MAG: menaquinone biosynthesis protein [Phycisphaerae bacterium]
MQTLRTGVVSFLNSRPLIDGLDRRGDVRLIFDVPSALAARLECGELDVALVPIIDVIRSEGRLRVVSDGCIACDGETMTVRVFSQTPPDRIQTLWVDGDSHTSIALATVLWRELFGRALEVRPFDSRAQSVQDCPSVLLIGDKVVRTQGGFAYEIDLGGAWRQHTGLPFVFAVWAAHARGDRQGAGFDPSRDRKAAGTIDREQAARATRFCSSRDCEGAGLCGGPSLFELLGAARDRGVARAREIAVQDGPPRWWPAELAVRYLTRCLKFKLDARYVEGADLFARLCGRYGLVPVDTEIEWPEKLLASANSEAPAACP